MPVPESYRVDMGRCVCGATLAPDGFRDRASYLDAYITSLCQACQDKIYLGADPDQVGSRFSVHEGSLVAVRVPGRSVAEICFLPFRLVARPRMDVVWEARSIVRAGPWLHRIDTSYELAPMSHLLAGHQIRVEEHRSYDSPALKERIAGLDLLVALDRPSLEASASVCALPNGVSRATLDDEVPWCEAFGHSLRPLRHWCGREDGVLSPLHTCALMGRILLCAGRAAVGCRRPLDYLLANMREPPFLRCTGTVR